MKFSFKTIAGAVVFAATMLTFAVNCRNDLVRYDDFDYIVKNEPLANGLNRRSVAWSVLVGTCMSNWHPLTWLSHAADISIARALGIDYRERENKVGMLVRHTGAFPHLVHVISLLLHALNAVLLYLFLLQFVRHFRIADPEERTTVACAAFFALLWALHPLRVEVVAWAAERKEILCTAFMLVALMLHLRGRFVLAFFAFCAAALAKPVAVSLPALLFAIDWLYSKKGFLASLVNMLPAACVAAAVCLITMKAQVTARVAAAQWSRGTHLLGAVEAPLIYLGQTFWPVGLSIDYPFPDWSSWPVFAGGCVFLLAIGAVCAVTLVRCVRGTQTPGWWELGALAVAWAYVGLIPMIGVVKVGYEPHCDHYTYWIGCGVAFCCCVAALRLAGLWTRQAREVGYCAGGLLAVLAVLSTVQSLHWRDTESLFSRVVAQTANEEFALPLAEDIIIRDRSRLKETEEMLRDVLGVKHSDEARAALAVNLASFGPARAILPGVSDEQATMFPEARLLAELSIGTNRIATMWAHAALGFADYREGRYKPAYAHMKKAVDMGYESAAAVVDLEEWREKAEK